ncbi:hypothetical protein D9M72_552330 [compost metagenome]
MRRPSPVLITPREMKKASITSQTRSVPVDLVTSAKDTTPASTPAVAPMMATAAMGSGAVMMPAMVATNTANMCHAFSSRPAGAGRNQRTMPIPTGTRNLQRSLRCPAGAAGFAAGELAGGGALAGDTSMISLLTAAWFGTPERARCPYRSSSTLSVASLTMRALRRRSSRSVGVSSG